MSLIKTISRKLVLDLGKWLKVESHVVGFPDGKQVADWPWLISPSYVIIFPRTQEGKFLCFRQPKYAIEGVGVAPVGGYIEPEEEPMLAAKREMLEETGYESNSWTPLGSFVVDGNHGGGTAHLFLAENARKVAEPIVDDLEEQVHIELTPEELRHALDSGEIKVLAWATGAALTLLHLQRQHQ